MSIEETSDIITGLAKKYGKIKELTDIEKEQYHEETVSQSAIEAEPLRHKNVCVTDQLSSREMLDHITKLFDTAVSRTITACDDLRFILDNKHVVQNTSEHSLSIPWHHHESTIQYFENINQILAKQTEADKNLSSLQCMDWKKMMKNLQHVKTLIQHKDMKVHRQLKIISQMVKGTVVSDDMKNAKNLVCSSDEEVSAVDSD